MTTEIRTLILLERAGKDLFEDINFVLVLKA